MVLIDTETGQEVHPSDHAVDRQPGAEEAALPKLEAPPFGKVEKRMEKPIPCFVRDTRGGLHRSEVIGMECDSGLTPPASYVCRNCRNAFDDPLQAGTQAQAVRCPKCKKKGVDIYPAQGLGGRYATRGRPGETVYLVQQTETQCEAMADDPDRPGKKRQVLRTQPIPANERTTGTLTADCIVLMTG